MVHVERCIIKYLVVINGTTTTANHRNGKLAAMHLISSKGGGDVKDKSNA